MNYRTIFIAIAVVIGLFVFRTSAIAVELTPPNFRKEVQPLLAEHCVKCHGPEKQKGGLRLDRKAAALQGGDSEEPAIVPKHSSQSRLIQVVTSEVDGERMPPMGERLTAGQIALLKHWIDTGADWSDSEVASDKPDRSEMQVTDSDRQHWSFLPLHPVVEPTVRDTAWPRTPVDQFILHAQEEMNLKPSAEADRRTLIRRLYFDVIGLPPSPEEIDDFEQSADPLAYEKMVDRLLDSKQYGERWSRHWLDIARYADSNGQEGDDDRPTAYHYRDFVIRAMNEDMAFDQFVRWQIAGDEFDPDHPVAVSATGFLTAGSSTRRA